MIKAQMTIQETEDGLVDVTIEAPASDDTETKGETVMLVTFMALNNLLADPANHKALASVLGGEIYRIVHEGLNRAS